MNEVKMTKLTQAEGMAYFRADPCLYSPESYSLEEKKEICNGMTAASKAVLDAMREDFHQLPPVTRASRPCRWIAFRPRAFVGVCGVAEARRRVQHPHRERRKARRPLGHKARSQACWDRDWRAGHFSSIIPAQVNLSP